MYTGPERYETRSLAHEKIKKKKEKETSINVQRGKKMDRFPNTSNEISISEDTKETRCFVLRETVKSEEKKKKTQL